MSETRYDCIVCGAPGTAGCLLANRLGADPGKRVLLIEAGGNDDYLWVRIPAAQAHPNLEYHVQPLSLDARLRVHGVQGLRVERAARWLIEAQRRSA